MLKHLLTAHAMHAHSMPTCVLQAPALHCTHMVSQIDVQTDVDTSVSSLHHVTATTTSIGGELMHTCTGHAQHTP